MKREVTRRTEPQLINRCQFMFDSISHFIRIEYICPHVFHVPCSGRAGQAACGRNHLITIHFILFKRTRTHLPSPRHNRTAKGASASNVLEMPLNERKKQHIFVISRNTNRTGIYSGPSPNL